MTLSKKDIIKTLDEMLKESEREREKAYESYCLFPNEIDSKDWDKYDERVAAITTVLNLLIKEDIEVDKNVN